MDVDKNYPFVLREKLQNDYEVYAFGISGVPLSEYFHISRYVNKYFDPDILIINLFYNDVDESIYVLNKNDTHWLRVSIDENGSIIEIPHHNPITHFNSISHGKGS